MTKNIIINKNKREIRRTFALQIGLKCSQTNVLNFITLEFVIKLFTFARLNSISNGQHKSISVEWRKSFAIISRNEFIEFEKKRIAPIS